MTPALSPGTVNATAHLRRDLSAALAIGLIGAALGHHYLGLRLGPATAKDVLWVLALAPALEEYVFRVLLQQGLARWTSGHAANALTALAFALAHAPVAGWMAIWWCLPSLLVGEIWRRHQAWWPCALVHVGFNLSLFGWTQLGLTGGVQ